MAKNCGIHEEFLESFFALIQHRPEIYLTAHINADPDALAAMVGISALIHHVFPEKIVHIISPQMNRLAQKVYADLVKPTNKWTVEKQFGEVFNTVVVLDTCDIEMTDIYSKNSAYKREGNDFEMIIIDHHTPVVNLSPSVVLSLIISEAASTAEIITEFFRCKEIAVSNDLARILLAGILTDTGHFRYATSSTLENAKYLLETGITLTEVTSVLNLPMTRPEKIARIRAAMRIDQLHYIGNYIIAISHVSSYEASASKALIDLGADLSFIIAFEKRDNKFRISSRGSEQFLLATSVHLGKVMGLVGAKFEGSGGGHAGAAGCYGIYRPMESERGEDFYVKPITREILKTIRASLPMGQESPQSGSDEP